MVDFIASLMLQCFRWMWTRHDLHCWWRLCYRHTSATPQVCRCSRPFCSPIHYTNGSRHSTSSSMVFPLSEAGSTSANIQSNVRSGCSGGGFQVAGLVYTVRSVRVGKDFQLFCLKNTWKINKFLTAGDLRNLIESVNFDCKKLECVQM